MKRKIILVVISILIICLSFLLYQDSTIIIAEINKDNMILINEKYTINDFVKTVSSGKLVNGDEEVKFSSLGENYIEAEFVNDIGKTKIEKIKVTVIDNEKPKINYSKTLTTEVGQKKDLIKNVKIEDNSNENIIPNVIGEYNFNIPGEYNLLYEAVDSSGNKETVPFTLIVNEVVPTKDTYYVKINKTQNVVMIYRKGENGEYNILAKTFVISAGNNTPVGIFKASGKAKIISFASGTYGRYATRIHKSFWFHSVPYKTRVNDDHWDNVLYNEYNKLGSLASAGCIRLAVKDAKWIYDNIPNDTTIEIYESDSLPEGVKKPVPIKIDINSENRGWDPTDSDPLNPLNN